MYGPEQQLLLYVGYSTTTSGISYTTSVKILGVYVIYFIMLIQQVGVTITTMAVVGTSRYK